MSLRYLTAGESHGKGLTTILEGLPSRVPVLQSHIDKQLKRRQQGYGRGGRMKIESDAVEITAGVRHGESLGSPIALWVQNKDFRAWTKEMASEPLEGFESKKLVSHPRPGHADLNGGLKYQHRDLRNILERASARETTIRVAMGTVCRQFLEQFDIKVTAHIITLGGVSISNDRPSFDSIQKAQEEDPCRCIDPEVSKQMVAKIDQAKKEGNSVGGVFEVIFTGVPSGLGSHVQWDRKLDADMAKTILSIQAVKGVEFGMGFDVGQVFGSEVHDGIYYDEAKHNFKRRGNNAGGFEGGMTTGENIIVRGVMKPIATLYTPLESVDIDSKDTYKASVERSDTCAVPACGVIAENVLCYDLANAMIQKFGGDSLDEMKRNYEGYLKQIGSY